MKRRLAGIVHPFGQTSRSTAGLRVLWTGKGGGLCSRYSYPYCTQPRSSLNDNNREKQENVESNRERDSASAAALHQQPTDQVLVTTSQSVALEEVANNTKVLAKSMEAKIVKALNKFYKWGPVVTTLEWINTNVTQYDGVFRHKQALDATFADLKAKEARQREIDVALEECEMKMYGLLQGKGNMASKKEVFDSMVALKQERDSLALMEMRERYERQYEHFVNEDLRFRLKMQAATWWATIISAVVWLVYSFARWLINKDRKREREKLNARLDALQASIASAAGAFPVTITPTSKEEGSGDSDRALVLQQYQQQIAQLQQLQQQLQQEIQQLHQHQQQQPQTTSNNDNNTNNSERTTGGVEELLRRQLREGVMDRVAFTLRQQKDYRCQWLGGRVQREALEGLLRKEVPIPLQPLLEVTMGDMECGPNRYDKVEGFILHWKETEGL